MSIPPIVKRFTELRSTPAFQRACEDIRASESQSTWQPIETAPKGGGAERTDDPHWVNPPSILIAFEDGEMSVCYFDWYYAEGGNGHTGLTGWVDKGSGEQAENLYGRPTHWMPLPPSPPLSDQ